MYACMSIHILLWLYCVSCTYRNKTKRGKKKYEKKKKERQQKKDILYWRVGKRPLRETYEASVVLFMCHTRMGTAEYIWRNWCLLDTILLQNCINTYTLHIVGELESIAREGKIYINLHLFQDLAAQHGKGRVYIYKAELRMEASQPVNKYTVGSYETESKV